MLKVIDYILNIRCNGVKYPLLYFLLLISIASPFDIYSQSQLGVFPTNNNRKYIKSNYSEVNNCNVDLSNSFIYKLNRDDKLFNYATLLELENHFLNEIVSFSKNEKHGLDIPIINYTSNNFKVKIPSTPVLDNYYSNRNYTFIKDEIISESFIDRINRNQFYNSYSFNKNSIQTTEFSILSFQSHEAGEYLEGTKIWGGIGFAMFGTLMILPRSVTKWEENYIEDAKLNFKRAFSEPPVWDEDHWEINYIGHPYAGSLYYNTIRSQGGSIFHSFLFSAFVSTGWEYLYEGMAEQPSIQDLIVTPVVGSILGEFIHIATEDMKHNGYSIWEAAFVTIFNPMEVIQNGYK